MSELTDVIDGLTGELEKLRELHAETLISHVDMCNSLSRALELGDLLYSWLLAYSEGDEYSDPVDNGLYAETYKKLGLPETMAGYKERYLKRYPDKERKHE